jgi:hypothetical protein
MELLTKDFVVVKAIHLVAIETLVAAVVLALSEKTVNRHKHQAMVVLV